MKDLYAVLGLSENATSQEIRAAYLRLVRRYHPDLNPGDPEAAERTREANAAYEILGNAEKRAAYDRARAAARRPLRPGYGWPGWSSPGPPPSVGWQRGAAWQAAPRWGDEEIDLAELELMLELLELARWLERRRAVGFGMSFGWPWRPRSGWW